MEDHCVGCVLSQSFQNHCPSGFAGILSNHFPDPDATSLKGSRKWLHLLNTLNQSINQGRGFGGKKTRKNSQILKKKKTLKLWPAWSRSWGPLMSNGRCPRCPIGAAATAINRWWNIHCCRISLQLSRIGRCVAPSKVTENTDSRLYEPLPCLHEWIQINTRSPLRKYLQQKCLLYTVLLACTITHTHTHTKVFRCKSQRYFSASWPIYTPLPAVFGVSTLQSTYNPWNSCYII